MFRCLAACTAALCLQTRLVHAASVNAISIRDSVDAIHEHRVELRVNVTEIDGDHIWAEVQWAGVHRPSFDDWVGVMAPANAHISRSTPVKYKLATDAPTHFSEGRGSVIFRLENHRTSLRVGFFYNGFANPRLVARSEAIHVKDRNLPQHGRVTLTHDNTEAVVQWTTADTVGGTVRWGKKPGQYTEEVDARDITYTRRDMCGGAAKHEGFLDPGLFHYALLTGLKPGHRYYYQFGSKETGFGEEFSFPAAPVVSPDTAVKMIALADMGQAELDGSNEQSQMVPSANTTRLMLDEVAKGGYSLVAHFGDISYARGHVSQWDRYHMQTEPLVANVPYMVAHGNHERDWPDSDSKFEGDDSGGECGVATERRYLMPTESQDAPWYAFDHGPVHFIVFSTEHTFHKGSSQCKFFERALAAVDRRRTPWLVVGGHRPFYIDSIDESEPAGDLYVAQQMRDALEDLYLRYNVDLTLHGHHHSYQRTCPIFNGTCQGYDEHGVAKAPVHVVIGNAGASLSHDIHREQPEVFEKVHMWWGFARLHVKRTRFLLESISDLDGSVIDSLELRKPKQWGKHWHDKHGTPAHQPKISKYWWQHEDIPPPPQIQHHSTQQGMQQKQAHERRTNAAM